MTTTVTNQIRGIRLSEAVKAPVLAVSSGNLTLSGLQTVGGVALAADDRVLVKDQTDAIENGIYEASSSAWQRAPDFDGNDDIVTGTLILTTDLDYAYRVTTTGSIVIGTSDIDIEAVILNQTQASIGAILFPRTDAEIAASVTPVNYSYKPKNVKRYGAVGDGVTDDTDAFVDAIAVAEAEFAALSAPYVFSGITVDLDQGGGGSVYRITSSLTVEKYITIVGPGAETCIVYMDANAPAFVVTQDTASTYSRTTFKGFSICGNSSGNWASAWTSLSQHGIKVNPCTGGTDARVSIIDVDIHRMNGWGIWLAGATNSCEIIGCRIQVNYAAGVYMSGTYNTNFTIRSCIIRNNRVGVYFNPDTDFTSGRIVDNLIESNVLGYGVPGSSLRPCVGIWMRACYSMTVSQNYCENHLNDLYMETSSYFNTFLDNYWMSVNSYNLVTTANYDGPPSRKFGIYIATAGTNNTFINNNMASRPEKPGGVTDAQWNTATWGAQYDHVQDDSGINNYIYNRCTYTDGTVLNGKLLVSGTNRHNIVNSERDPDDGSGRNINNIKAFKARTTHSAYYETTGNGQLIKQIDIITNPTQELFNFTGSSAASYHVKSTNVGDVAQDNPFGIVYRTWTDGSTGSFKWSYGSAAPGSGAHTVGEIVFNNAPSAGGTMGWVCTTAGTPGTWKTFGAIAA